MIGRVTLHVDTGLSWGGGQEQALALVRALLDDGEAPVLVVPPGSAPSTWSLPSPISTRGGSSRSRFTNTMKPVSQRPTGVHCWPLRLRHIATSAPDFRASCRATYIPCTKRFTAVVSRESSTRLVKAGTASVSSTAPTASVVSSSRRVYPVGRSMRAATLVNRTQCGQRTNQAPRPVSGLALVFDHDPTS